MNYLALGFILLIAVYFFIKSRTAGDVFPVKYSTIDVATAKEMIKNETPILIDVRMPMELAGGKIEGALNINVAAPLFKSEINKLDKTKTYIIYCRSGRRSVNACKLMSKEGFESLYNLEGGFNKWK